MKILTPCLCLVIVCPLMANASNRPGAILFDADFIYDERIVAQEIETAAASQHTRAEAAFLNATGEGLREAFCPLFADLWLGRELDRTNAALLDLFTTEDPVVQQKYRLNDAWCLAINQQFYHMYYAFGTKGSIAPGRLYPETERALLELLWERMKYKDDISLARKSTWWMAGSD